MGLIAASNGAKYEPIPEGVYNAQCYSIVDLGTQYNEKFGNSSRKVLLTWELPDETIEIEGVKLPRAVSREYTLSLSEKANLRRDLEAWRSKKFDDVELKGFDLKNVLGKGCQLQIIHTKKDLNTYANIAAIMALPKGVKLAVPTNDLVYFDLEADTAIEMLNKLPTWIVDKIRKSETYKEMNSSAFPEGFPSSSDEDDSDLPF